MPTPLVVYWANSIFGEADRRFNDLCASRIRQAGYVVLSPQELAFNEAGGRADATEIFRSDTALVARADVLVACIDQEAIDCGVACELGIAWAQNKSIIGLYTDFRQHRVGEFKMYKNPYVIGCIQDKGTLVRSVEELLDCLEGLQRS